jgi:hypothetical protein
MKLMLPLPPYHTIYLTIKLSRINLMLIRLEDCFIPLNLSLNFKHLRLHDYPLNTITRPMFC